MPIFGLGLHILIALFFAVHVVRSGREMYWLFVLFSFPLLGSLVYFLAVFLPHSRLDHGLRKAGRTIEKSINPGRALREAQDAFGLTPTAHNQMRLARAMYEAGMMEQAVTQFDACLSGPFAKDPEINLGAAMARLANGQAADAVSVLEALRRHNAGFRPEQVGLLLAKAYAQAGRPLDAGAEFDSVVSRFSSLEARGEYALWALASGDLTIARRELKELDHARKHMSKYTRGLHQDLFRRIDAERAKAGV